MDSLLARLRQGNFLVWAGLALMTPAITLCLGGILQSFLGITQFYEVIDKTYLGLVIFNPVLVLGGLLASFGLNLLPVLKVSYQGGVLTGSVRLLDRLPNLALVTLVALLLATIFVYLLAENFQIFAA